MDFQAIRKEYEHAGIQEENMLDDPMAEFEKWYQLAVDQCPAEWFEPNAMCVATADQAGRVTNRLVLLKGVVDDGIQFFSNYDSQKGIQIADNPQCAATFHWPYMGRSVRFEGSALRTDRQVSEDYFHSRPRGSQISAAASQQSKIVDSRETLESQQESIARQFEDSEIPLPSNWGGYVIQPIQIEFWQGRLDRLHDRVVYRKQNSCWNRIRLSP
ncbi:MAG: pyridoxamine 5'-phosphate oxidase [Planctomycetota bacterium]